ncbi:amino acid adenylation domain-containing protein [Nocardia sp. 2YAB30]
MTYRELDEYSSRLARVLIARGVGPEGMVALSFPRSYEMVAAFWAVAKAGGAHVPIDPTYPEDRKRHMVNDSGAVIGITATEYVDRLPRSVEWLRMDDPEFGELVESQSAEPVTDADRTSALSMRHPVYVIYTSGSTGMPKGVTVTHAGMGGLAGVATDLYQLESHHRFLHICSPSFDPSVLEWLCAAYTGATLVIVPSTIIGGSELAELLRTERVTHTIITPAVLGTVDPAGIEALEVASVGGDVTTPELLAKWAPGRKYFNAYGPTETTIISSYANLTPGRHITIGRPVLGMSALVLDNRLNPVPPGVAGELYLAGGALARGYHNRPDLTAERFVANPWSNEGARMYRTGDVVRWFAEPGEREGNAAVSSVRWELDYVGRSDFQVKIRGFRIELGEIDAVLGKHEDVEYAITLGRQTAAGATILVSYVLAAPGREVDTARLTEYASRSLPPHMVPTAIMVIDEIPLTPVGKLDREALPSPVFEAKVFRAPSTPIEEIVAGTFMDVLGVTRLGLDDNFFELGGNSLLATQVTSRLSAALDTQLAVRDLFDASTVFELAARVERNAGSGRARPRLVAGERPERVPLSLAQQRYWFLNQFDTSTSAVDNIPLAVRLSGALDVAALGQAIGDVFARHELLRTTYPRSVDGPHQVIHPVAEIVPVLVPVEVAEADLLQTLIEFARISFDVTVEVPLSVALFRIIPEEHGTESETVEHVVAFSVYHIASDGASTGPLARDVMAAYLARVNGEVPRWEPLPVQYADFAVWQRAVLGSEEDPESLAAQQVAYWKTTLAGLPEQLELPTDRPRPPAQSFQGKAIRFEISPDRHKRLQELARANNASLFMVVHAALAVLLARLSGTDDIAVGTPIAGRGERELDDLIGMFVNTLVFRTKVDGDMRFSELLAGVRERDLEGFAHADVPFERLVEVLNPVRSTARNPLFQVSLLFQNYAETTFELPGLTASPVDFDMQLAKTDLEVTLYDRYAEDGTPAEILTEFAYAIDLFDEATVQGFADRFVMVLDAIIADVAVPVGEIDLLAPAERDRILHEWNDTGYPVGSELLLDGYRRAVATSPDAVAVVFEGVELTYREFV